MFLIFYSLSAYGIEEAPPQSLLQIDTEHVMADLKMTDI